MVIGPLQEGPQEVRIIHNVAGDLMLLELIVVRVC